MTLTEQSALSFYKELAPLKKGHAAMLVQHIDTQKLYVKKRYDLYDPTVFQYLQNHPVPCTPRIVQIARDDDALIVIEEYLAGDTLQEILDQKGTLSEADAANYTLQLCRILNCLHSASVPIIHRDIKPSNIIISPDGVLKLLDMNAAKMAAFEKSKDTVLMGTAGYAAPEQYGFAASHPQTDIYAIGVLLNVMLTGQLPQNGMTRGRFSSVVQSCTQIDWHFRFQTVNEVSAAIQKAEQPAYRPSAAQTQNHPYRLPGLRTGNPLHIFLGLLGYLFLFFLSCSLQVAAGGPLQLLLNRFMFFLSGMSIILFSADYLHIQSRVGISRYSNRLVRWLSVAVIDFALLLGWVLLTVILEGLFFGA